MKKLTLSILALLALTLTGCEENRNRPIIVNNYDVYTDTIRGHVYLHVVAGGILHDPDCPCHKKGGPENGED